MQKLLLTLLFVSAATSLSAQPDSLDYRCDYYTTRRNLQEGTGVVKGDIVMLGNSLTERGAWAEYFRRCSILNRGIGGDCVAGMIARLDSIVTGEPRIICIMAGVNDLIFSKITPETLCRQYERLLEAIHRGSPRTKVYIQSLLPLDEKQNTQYFTGKNSRIATFNTQLRKLAQRRGLTYIDIWSQLSRNGTLPEAYTIDGIHLNAAGYARWVETLRPYLK